ncbi:hypothetical protein EV421DRAFT_2025212 [Armillaria borealis]|uniref:Uncharacterized protein n=1 Tax=Armillaria borealis TaxID=47425 RepID=A0AA39IWM3_9AGAR|nr:hypothetical protein EV421DRAFT_2025212 [Armillaria borealis]
MTEDISVSSQPCRRGCPKKYEDDEDHREARAATQAHYYQRHQEALTEEMCQRYHTCKPPTVHTCTCKPHEKYVIPPSKLSLPKKSSLPKRMMCQILQYHAEMLQITMQDPVKHAHQLRTGFLFKENASLDAMEKALKDIDHCQDWAQRDLDAIYQDSGITCAFHKAEEIVGWIGQAQGYHQDILEPDKYKKHILKHITQTDVGLGIAVMEYWY